jgi:hypothetical protein
MQEKTIALRCKMEGAVEDNNRRQNRLRVKHKLTLSFLGQFNYMYIGYTKSTFRVKSVRLQNYKLLFFLF